LPTRCCVIRLLPPSANPRAARYSLPPPLTSFASDARHAIRRPGLMLAMFTCAIRAASRFSHAAHIDAASCFATPADLLRACDAWLPAIAIDAIFFFVSLYPSICVCCLSPPRHFACLFACRLIATARRLRGKEAARGGAECAAGDNAKEQQTQANA